MKGKIVLAVTSPQSLRLMTDFPDYLAKQGWEVHVVCSNPPDNASDAYTLHHVPMQRTPAPLSDLKSLISWIQLLRDIKPNMVVAGTPKAGLLGTLASAVTRVPKRVYLLRGLRSSTESGLRRTFLNALERLTVTAATEVQSVSHSLMDEVVQLGLCSPNKVTVVGQGSSNGVELASQTELATSASARRRELKLPDRPTIGFIGRLHPDKGLDTLLDAFDRIAQNRDVQLLLVGAEEPVGQLKSSLERLSPELHEHVTWVGHQDNPAPFYRAMDVLSLPSKREGFPNVVLEAASHAIPTIAADVTGCRDAVLTEQTGLLVPSGDTQAFTAALDRLIDDIDLCHALGNNARLRVEREFSRDHVWANLEAYYRSRLHTRKK